MNNYHLVYNDAVQLRNFSYRSRPKADDDEEWKHAPETGPRAALVVPYRIWMRDPGQRAVLLFECPSTQIAFDAFGRLVDLVRAVANNVRPWRAFSLVNADKGFGLLYDIKFVALGDEYQYSAAKLVKLKELSEIVGDEHFQKYRAKP